MWNSINKELYINIIVDNASIVNSIIENAITKVRLFEPNSLIRERADIFVKIHLVPMDQLIKIEKGAIIPSAYIIDLALIGPSVARVKEYLDMHEDGSLTLVGGWVRLRIRSNCLLITLI